MDISRRLLNAQNVRLLGLLKSTACWLLLTYMDATRLIKPHRWFLRSPGHVVMVYQCHQITTFGAFLPILHSCIKLT